MKIIIVKKGNFEYAYKMNSFKEYIKSFDFESFDKDFSPKDFFDRLKNEPHDFDYGDYFEIIGRTKLGYEIYLKGRRVTLK